MNGIRLRLREQVQRRWRTLFDLTVDPMGGLSGAPDADISVNELSRVILQIYPEDTEGFEARVWIGRVIVASTLVEGDRPLYAIEPTPGVEGQPEHLWCAARLFSDAAGPAVLRVEGGTDGQWRQLVQVTVYVNAGKLAQEEFERLCADIASESAGLLLDVYGKTYVGIQPATLPGESAPVILLNRIAEALNEFRYALRGIAREPACRLKCDVTREPVFEGQAVDYDSLAEACIDPCMVTRRGSTLCLREAVREVARQSYDREENRVLTGFLRFVDRQLSELLWRLTEEITVRNERRRFRSGAKAPGEPTWWESEDMPRVNQLRRHYDRVCALKRRVAELSEARFLPDAAALSDVPRATPLFRAHPHYRRAFRVIRQHVQAYRVNLDEYHLLTVAKSLPKLYEWWCVLIVLRILQKHLALRSDGSYAQDQPFKAITEQRTRFVVEFSSDQHVDFLDVDGRCVRLRYEPRYVNAHNRSGPQYGILGLAIERTPDLAIEVYDAIPQGQPPRCIIVCDAKYTTWPQERKLLEVREKYAKIGCFDTGELLSRQVWAFTPMAPDTPEVRSPEWAELCTVDNIAFWSPAFDIKSPVCGAIQMRPLSKGGNMPVEALIVHLLDRMGVRRSGK